MNETEVVTKQLCAICQKDEIMPVGRYSFTCGLEKCLKEMIKTTEKISEKLNKTIAELESDLEIVTEELEINEKILEDSKSWIDQFIYDFYGSKEWREVRYAAIEKYGRKCMACGSTPDDGIKIHVDHIKPRSKYPALELNLQNLQILCEPCNLGKSNKFQTDWRPT